MVKPYQNSSSSKKEQVTTMFNGIADNYDSLNRVISMGIDKSWRRKLVAMAANKKPKTIVDVATGTGDLAIALTSIPSATVTGIDIAIEMLEIGKHDNPSLCSSHAIKSGQAPKGLLKLNKCVLGSIKVIPSLVNDPKYMDEEYNFMVESLVSQVGAGACNRN